MKRSKLLTGLVAAVLVLPGAPVLAQGTKIVVGYTVTVDFASGFIAMDQGLFKKRGLDVEYKLVPLGSQLPAAVQSDSITVGGTTVSVFLQAVDGGLDHVAIAGSGVIWKGQDSFGAVVRTDLPYAKPDDFIGKKVATPGLGGFLHVLFRNWLIDNGVDFKKVTFVEVGFPQMADVLKSKNVDAVVTGEPVMGRIQQAGIGRQVTSMTDHLKGDLPTIVYSATRKWVEANPAVAKAFYEAIAEGAAIANRDEVIGYMSMLAREERAVFGSLLRRIMPVQVKADVNTSAIVLEVMKVVGHGDQRANGQAGDGFWTRRSITSLGMTHEP